MNKNKLITLLGVVLIVIISLAAVYFFNKKKSTSTSTSSTRSMSTCSARNNKRANNNSVYSKSNYVVLDVVDKNGVVSGLGTINSIKIDGKDILDESTDFEFAKQINVNRPVKNGQSFVITISNTIMQDDSGHKIVTKMIDNGKTKGNTIAIKI